LEQHSASYTIILYIILLLRHNHDYYLEKCKRKDIHNDKTPMVWLLHKLGVYLHPQLLHINRNRMFDSNF